MKKIPVWKNVVLIISTFVGIMIATFAWFYNGPTADAENINMDVGEGYYIQISVDGGNNWSGDLDVELGIKNEFKELSGNGSSLYAPVYDIAENATGGFSTQIISFDEVTDGEYYCEQVFDFRASITKSLYLSPESYVISQNDGHIDGAIRVAFFEIDDKGKETLQYIWAPNSTVEYSVETNSFTREGNVEPYYYYQKSLNPDDISGLEESNSNIARVSTEGTDESGCGYNPEYKFMWTNGQNMPVNAPAVMAVDKYGNDNHTHKRLKVKVWLEGYDRECVSLLSGQRFTIKLQFYAR